MYYVYMLRCRDGSLYVGFTNDLERRFAEHRDGINRNCYTMTGVRSRLPTLQGSPGSTKPSPSKRS
jgi:predicted GIY-YIG superfamily endonuclease